MAWKRCGDVDFDAEAFAIRCSACKGPLRSHWETTVAEFYGKPTQARIQAFYCDNPKCPGSGLRKLPEPVDA